ncbi:hypothetical protein [Xenorhabdus stockiae]|uniref:hypothetical protein n=1 Tax=Xenorhabdus stockiae TaxID=351614 RepID=UPI004063F7BA
MSDLLSNILEIIDSMPEPIPSTIVLIVWIGMGYFLYASALWFISVPLGLFFAFLFAKKAKRKIAKILYALLSLALISPTIIAFIFVREILTLLFGSISVDLDSTFVE